MKPKWYFYTYLLICWQLKWTFSWTESIQQGSINNQPQQTSCEQKRQSGQKASISFPGYLIITSSFNPSFFDFLWWENNSWGHQRIVSIKIFLRLLTGWHVAYFETSTAKFLWAAQSKDFKKLRNETSLSLPWVFPKPSLNTFSFFP